MAIFHFGPFLSENLKTRFLIKQSVKQRLAIYVAVTLYRKSGKFHEQIHKRILKTSFQAHFGSPEQDFFQKIWLSLFNLEDTLTLC